MKDPSQTSSPLPDSHESSIVGEVKTTKSGWSKKRKIWNAIILLIAIAMIIVAIVVPVVLTKQSRREPSYQELYFPRGYNGTSLNGVLEGSWRNTTYDRLVVFGSSYSDNAHPRASQYSGSFAGSGYWERRWSNGPVWVEYLKDYLGSDVTHLNYAYGGATTNNSIHLANSPDTSQQMATYMQENYTADAKPIVAMFTTTNDITATFRDYLSLTSGIYQNRSSAMSVISQSAQSLVNQLARLIPSDTSATAPDYLILPILPVELSPQSRQLAADANATTDAIGDITRQYNRVLLDGARSIARQLGSRGSVFTYDVPSWYYAMVDNPSKYSLQRIQKGYTQDGSGSVTSYLWYDHLHLPTHLQRHLARLSANIIFNTTTMP